MASVEEWQYHDPDLAEEGGDFEVESLEGCREGGQ